MAISLAKGQRVSLEKETGRRLDKVIMGLGWDVRAKKKGLFGFLGGGDNIDLDASAALFDANGRLTDQVWFSQLSSRDGSIRHSGDNLTVAGEGDDEQIQVDLSQVPSTIQSVIFVVSSYSKDTFDSIENAYCRLVDAATGSEVLRYSLTGQGAHTAQIMLSLYRKDSGWSVRAIGEKTQGRTIKDLARKLQNFL